MISQPYFRYSYRKIRSSAAQDDQGTAGALETRRGSKTAVLSWPRTATAIGQPQPSATDVRPAEIHRLRRLLVDVAFMVAFRCFKHVHATTDFVHGP